MRTYTYYATFYQNNMLCTWVGDAFGLEHFMHELPFFAKETLAYVTNSQGEIVYTPSKTLQRKTSVEQAIREQAEARADAIGSDISTAYKYHHFVDKYALLN